MHVEGLIIQEEDAVLEPRVLTHLIGFGASLPHEQYLATQHELDLGPRVHISLLVIIWLDDIRRHLEHLE